MEELFDDRFCVEIIEALNSLKNIKAQEKDTIKKDIIAKRKEMGMNYMM